MAAVFFKYHVLDTALPKFEWQPSDENESGYAVLTMTLNDQDSTEIKGLLRHAFIHCIGCVFKVITLVSSRNQLSK